MAFSTRLGCLIRQSISKNSVSSGSISAMPMLNAVRCMSSSKLFVGGLSYSTNDQMLKDAFTSFGDVTEVKVITDRDTGRSKGYGFVNFDSTDAASAALSSMNGQELHGRNITVNYANDRPSGGGFRGGYGDGGGYRRSTGGDGF
ncbi:hypothetical protein QJS10_CPB22g00715 [Acorus calamus]|uniref:RRM domain-containing protein n=1 Tax=Acorus calamus TaxID=4465 RepID=A0AAV9BZA2_ACOCL|nr:hypothetical protein QJS10_CPB22g00715 [Acorus calamus]